MNLSSRLLLAAALVGSVCVAAPAAGPTVTPTDGAGLKRAIAAKKGKVVVVNFWATWCGPCVEEFPSLIQLRDKYKARGVDLVTVSADMTKDVSGKVTPFLTKNRVSKDAFILKSDVDDVASKLDPKWDGALPRTLVYGRDGKLAKVLAGKQTPAAFEAAVKPLLK